MSHLLEQARGIAHSLVEETSGINLILIYGSLARGTENEFSDIDMLIVSDVISVSWSFVLNGCPVSAHTMTWDEIAGLAKGQHGTWSVGASVFEHGKILWSRPKAVERRFTEISTYVPNGSQE
ncbi:MAG: nucleotidyltransferase domain-containing protein [Candidatus Thorarchaeota archaeon]|nr:nucleotidyltransferase domain-containing protein [Candidatus Thorarchaeota archaeon]